MNYIKQFVTLILLFSGIVMIKGQNMVDAGPNQTIVCSGSVQLNATPMNAWAEIKTLESTMPAYSIFFPTEESGFAVNSDGMVYQLFEGGKKSSPGQRLTTYPLYSVYFIDPLTGFTCSASGEIFKTTNAGNTWGKVSGGTTATLRSIFFTSATTGYIAGSEGTILKTKDGGTTWIPLTSGTNSQLFSVFFSTPEIGYVAGDMGVLLKTTDAGSTWVPQTTGVSTTLYSIYFPTLTTGFVTGATGTLLKTTDGTTWSKYAADSVYMETGNGTPSKTVGRLMKTAYLNSVHFTSVTTGYIAGSYVSSGIFLKTIDGGTTWFEQPSNANTKMTSLCFPSENVGYASGGLGKILKVTMGEMKPLVYSWSPTYGLSSPNISNPVASPSVLTKYSVYAYDPINPTVTFTDTVVVSIKSLSVNLGSDRIIGCEGSVVLDSLKTNYTGSGKLKYQWTPMTGLSSDTIAFPIASVTVPTTYTVKVSTPNGCSATGQIRVSVAPLAATALVDKAVICSGTAQLLATTNYSGKSSLHYKWTPATGLNNDAIANPVANISSQTIYNVNVTSDSGCSATASVIVKVTNPTANAGADKMAVCGSQVQLGEAPTNYTTSDLIYKWTPAEGLNKDNIANPIAIAGNITYTLTVTTLSGCTASDNVAIHIIPLDKPVINYVGINVKNKNMLAWTKPAIGGINCFNVYKETNVTNSYLKIGSVAFDSESIFEDTNSNPDVQSNKYKISIVDACSNETGVSDYHKTMHLTINKGINTIWNLIWEAYEGYAVSTYNIYRGTTPENIQLIGSLSGSNTQFTDYTASEGYVFYQIEAISSVATGVKLQNKTEAKSLVETTFSSRSNIATNKSGNDGLNNLKDISKAISIYPNPASNSIQLTVDEYNVKDMKLNIYNALGSLVLTKDILQNNQALSISNLQNGIYLVEIKIDKYCGIQKLIIQK